MTVAWGNILQGDAAAIGLIMLAATPETVASGARGGLVYLATPYSREVRGRGGRWSFEKSVLMQCYAAQAADALLAVGITAISPIVQAAAMVQSREGRGVDPLDRDAWTAWCRPMLNACAALVVPDVPGWQRSEGVHAEVAWALSTNRRVYVYAGGL